MFSRLPIRFRRPSLRSSLISLVALLGFLGMAVGSGATWEPELIHMVWAKSPRANSADWCPEGRICVEWCRVYQGQIEEATGRLCCGTPDMEGSDNPLCPPLDD